MSLPTSASPASPSGAGGRASSWLSLLHVEADQDDVAVRQVPDEALQGGRELLDQRRHGDDLVVPGPVGLLEDVDHLELVAPGEMLLADLLRVADRARGPLGRPG